MILVVHGLDTRDQRQVVGIEGQVSFPLERSLFAKMKDFIAVRDGLTRDDICVPGPPHYCL